MTASLGALVFSMDRPCQLDLLLRSLARPELAGRLDVTVLYRFTTSDVAAGYRKVRSSHPSVCFTEERTTASLKGQILELLDGRASPWFTFFTDDDVCIRPFSDSDPEFAALRDRPDVLALSLRLHPCVTYCQPLQEAVAVPPFGPGRTWAHGHHPSRWIRWIRRHLPTRFPRGDWALPYSMNATVYRREELRAVLASVEEFASIPLLEPRLNRRAAPRPLLACYEAPRVVNVALNRVDRTNRYPAGSISVHDLNREFLAGKRLRLDAVAAHSWVSCHAILEPAWES